ncbi:DegS peptidase [Cricetibacter osteomyelitidis]|uniref:Serine endoprotease DegS n=1 Tax=Cricetibacter osteomyelitidis TaxID=1521931 RepID=A0A4R2TLN3_9PAST|nr:outer membrane-stress sensor serine endopeptidase DegS [Cricetibacter osteomyelitidis]TCP95772.1 DegS peptidase [Cricetibacter osteomyelitidis]
MIKKLIKSAVIGLLAALLILLVIPQFRSMTSFYLSDDVVSFKSAVRLASPAVVNVYNRSFSATQNNSDTELEVRNLGSGVIMSKDGYILTNRHVIQNADQIVVALQSGQVSSATLVGSDNLTDIAVLKINAENLPTIPQNPDRQISVGDVVLAIGNPYNLGQSVSQGIISATGRNAVGDASGRQNFIQTDASINRGNSGGALINSLGELIGISTLSIGKDSNEIAEGLNFAIPIDIANKVMHKIIRDGRVIRGYLGVGSNILYSNGKGFDGQGVLISSVAPNGPAEKAGIQAGDVIVKMDNTEIHSAPQMMELISDTAPYTQINVSVLRLGKILVLPVTIGELIVPNTVVSGE